MLRRYSKKVYPNIIFILLWYQYNKKGMIHPFFIMLDFTISDLFQNICPNPT
jgi:hypothetical protein